MYFYDIKLLILRLKPLLIEINILSYFVTCTRLLMLNIANLTLA